MEDNKKVALAIGGYCPNGKKHAYVNTNVEHIEGDWFKVSGGCAGCGIEWNGKIRVIEFEIQEMT